MDKKHQRNPQKKKAFTLIELLVVISIIGILSVLVVVSLGTARARARNAQRKAQLNSIANGLAMYYDQLNTYPTGSTTLTAGNNYYLCYSNSTTASSSFVSSCSGTTFVGPFTVPQGSNYSYTGSATTFRIEAPLEGETTSFVCDQNGCR